ncbi:MAG: glycosyltransferase [Candidatus Peribacteraceae bacterium]|nr:glycosyltransferase [Candidatus Peribacteraceae bacterium]
MGQVVRLLQDHTFRDTRGRALLKRKGDTHNIVRRSVLTNLCDCGVVERLTLDGVGTLSSIACLKPHETRMRFAFFCNTSIHYSGGRIHLYQYAWALAAGGVDVQFYTDRKPIWVADYPKQENLHIVVGKSNYPKDIDVLVTDGKQSYGARAIAYRKQNPRTKLVLMNFETPNWVAKFNERVSKKMQHTMDVCKAADLLVCNSDESAKYLREYLTTNTPIEILNPAANNLALKQLCKIPLTPEERKVPFVVWSSRASAYKRRDVAIDSVMSYNKPLNIICIGASSGIKAKSTSKHKIISFNQPIDDAQKMWLMKHAEAVIAPSEFEGFGMVPAEALCCGTPVVVFDLPVLRQNYGDRLVYAKWKDSKDFTKKLHEVLDGTLVVHVDKQEAVETYGMSSMERNVRKLRWHNIGNTIKITAQMICYYGATVQQAIASVYPYVDEIKIAYGPTKLWKDKKPDNSLQLIQDFPDPDNKIELEVRKEWVNKSEMRDWCASRATGNRMLIFDADEIFDGLDKWIKEDPKFACPKWVHFWHNNKFYVVDKQGEKRWGTPSGNGCYHNHYRWSFWKPSYSFSGTKGTQAKGCNQESLSLAPETQKMSTVCPDTFIYHLGHTLNKETMANKHDFYLKRDGADAGRKKRKTAWHDWDGSTLDCGDGMLKEITWDLPALVKEAFQVLEIDNA